MQFPRYDISRSYEWNYANAPEPANVDVPDFAFRSVNAGQSADGWTFLGQPVPSPLGVPAGPLLNGRWVLYYASLGFDILTYKTVRSSARPCYPLPNLLPVNISVLHGGERNVPATESSPSWAVSFGMPSAEPNDWRRDIAWTRDRLDTAKKLVVSVVGTMQDNWTIQDLADDYAQCARWARESGADAVEANFSCPNVSTCDGQLYQQPPDAAVVAATIRAAIGDFPFIAKIGHIPDTESAEKLLQAIGPHVNGIAMTNSVAATVVYEDGREEFSGQPRGICGQATFTPSLQQVQMFARLRTSAETADPMPAIIGVGGATRFDDVIGYLQAGAESVHMATAVMLQPDVALQIRQASCDLRRQVPQ